MSRSKILWIAFLAIVAVNLWGALPSFHYAPWTDMSHDDVRVYTPHAGSADAIPIQRVDTAQSDPFISTGQTVDVYVRSGYRNSGAQTYPRITLLISIIALLLLLFARRRSQPEQPEI